MYEILLSSIGVAAVCILLAIAFHFLAPMKGTKVPAVVLGTVAGFALGAASGLLLAVVYGEKVHWAIYADTYKPSPMPSGPPGQSKGMAPPTKGGGSGGPSEAKNKEGGGAPGAPNHPANYPGMIQRAKGQSGGGRSLRSGRSRLTSLRTGIHLPPRHFPTEGHDLSCLGHSA